MPSAISGMFSKVKSSLNHAEDAMLSKVKSSLANEDSVLNKLKSSIVHEDSFSQGTQQVSYRATHVDLVQENESIGNYYDDFSDQPIKSLRFPNTFLATHRISQERRCIKIVRKVGMSEEHFWRQVENYKATVHPNILHLYETLEDKENYYFVEDRKDRPNLYQAIPKIFPNKDDFDEVQVALVVRCILKTLMFCHQKGVIHSDLTYENILLDPSKELRSLYIAGFGNAVLYRRFKNYKHRLTQSDRNGDSSRSNSLRSSDSSSHSHFSITEEEEEHIEGVQPGDMFAAPETRRGDLSEFEAASDVWSTGIIAYQLLTRHHPFEDKGVWPANYNDLQWKTDHLQNSPILSHLSEEAKDLLSQLLCYIPSERPTAEEALQHSWFRIADKAGKKVKKKALNDCLTNLQNFHAHNKLEQATRMYIVSNLLQSEERAQLDACFRHLDKNRNNVITREELRQALKKSRSKDKVVRIETMLEDIFDRIDVKKTGEIEYTEFLAAAADDSVVLTRENLWTTFNAFDKSRTGKIDVKDLMRLFNEGRDKKVLRTKEAKRLIGAVDHRGDGEINFDEFCDLMQVK